MFGAALAHILSGRVASRELVYDKLGTAVPRGTNKTVRCRGGPAGINVLTLSVRIRSYDRTPKFRNY